MCGNLNDLAGFCWCEFSCFNITAVFQSEQIYMCGETRMFWLAFAGVNFHVLILLQFFKASKYGCVET